MKLVCCWNRWNIIQLNIFSTPHNIQAKKFIWHKQLIASVLYGNHDAYIFAIYLLCISFSHIGLYRMKLASTASLGIWSSKELKVQIMFHAILIKNKCDSTVMSLIYNRNASNVTYVLSLEITSIDNAFCKESVSLSCQYVWGTFLLYCFF